MTSINRKKRIQSLGHLWGIALLGIFLVNMLSFHSPYLYYNPYEWWSGAQDYQHFRWLDIFVEASFYPLAALLFGYGAAMHRENVLAKRIGYPLIAMRSCMFLLFVGIVHAFFVWPGDILISFALFGLILIPLLKLPGKPLLIIGTLLLFVPNVFLGVLGLLMAAADPTGAFIWTDITGINQSMAAYGSGSFQEITQQRIKDWLLPNHPESIAVQAITVFPLFLIGAGAQKENIIASWTRQPRRAIRTFGSFFAAGVILKSLPYMSEPDMANLFVQDSVGGPLLSISYAALVIGAGAWSLPQKILYPFAVIGRMPLTNYLMQSVAGTLIFYNYGLGLYGQITLTTGIWLVLAIYTAQVVLSELWLSKFSRGPAESLWRQVTYGRKKRKEVHIR
ncbi:DUF418 domain-containing protein [Bacillus xiapuensis]|uniref:DUF418 domain-containing protein n=1 Tax=Bacillus xiapuensis TaxID=2014075 RepID=UPI000C25146F|nr:DUF418 domain-containing protein [Bacillus xiapuensis]